MLSRELRIDPAPDALQSALLALCKHPGTELLELVRPVQAALYPAQVTLWQVEGGALQPWAGNAGDAAVAAEAWERTREQRVAEWSSATGAALAAGVWRGGVLVGLVLTRRSEGGAWSPGARMLITALADRAALALEAGRSEAAEIALAERVRHVDEVEELVRIGSWEFDVRENRIAWSREQLRIHGLQPDQAPRTFEEFLARVHPEDRERMAGETLRVAEGGGPFVLEYRVVRPDGAVRELSACGRMVYDGAGAALRMVGTSHDVTEQRRTEQELRASEESYRTIFDSSNDAIMLHDLETGRVVDANQRACELMGAPLSALRERGLDVISMGPPPYTAEAAQQRIRLAASGTPQRFEWLSFAADGAEVWTEVALQRVCIGGQQRLLGVVHDIRERKEAEHALRRSEEALRRSNEELELRVRERTAELAVANEALEEEVAEHEAAKDALLQRTREMEGIFQALPDRYYRLDREGRVLDHRAGSSEAPFRSAAEITGRLLRDVVPPETSEPLLRALDEVGRSGRLALVEYLHHVDGEPRDYEARVLPLGDGTHIMLVRDITVRKQAERALRDREEHFRKLIENTSDIVTILDADGTVRYQSPALERLFGYAPEALVGCNVFDFVHPDDHAATEASFVHLLRNPGSNHTATYRFRHRDGSWRVVESTGRTMHPDSPVEGVVVSTRDVTERVEAEAELARQRAYFEQLLTGVDAGVAVWDAQGCFEYVSANSIPDPHFRARAIGMTHHEYGAMRGVSRDTVDRRQFWLETTLTRRTQTEFEDVVVRADGSSAHLLRRYRPVLNELGEVERVIGYSIDITERKHAEEALRQATVEAEQAREAAERANRAKSEFLSRMSHELRTPMNSILGFAQLLDRASLPPEHKKGVGHILKAGRHLLKLINEVLEISRIEAGRQKFSLEAVRLDAVVQEAVGLVRPLAAQWQVEVEDAVASPHFVMADRQRLVQVLLNLLANAIKYNRPGGRVRITQAVPENGAGISVRVEDTGRGIAAERLEQLFTPFARLGAEQTEVEGTGLGLALSQRLCEAMQGSLQLESTGPAGSCFRVELLPADDPLAAVEEQGERVPADAGDHRAATILYVEDNLANLSLVETILLSRPAWRTMPALQGQLGVELARQHRPDLILLDLHLPDMHGREVLRRLRADARTAHIPVVVVSADATRSSVEELRSGGADGYLTKPLDVDEFLDTLERFLGVREET